MSLTTTTPSQPYELPEAKNVRKGLKWLFMFGLAALGATLFVKVAPTFDKALELLTKLTTDFTFLAINVAIACVVVFLVYQIISPNGKINQLLAMRFNSLINQALWASLNKDPLTPFYERQKEVRNDKGNLENAEGKLEGVMERIDTKAKAYAKEAEDHKRKFGGAQSDTARFGDTAKLEARAYQRCLETAETFRTMYNNLVPVQAKVRKLMEAANDADQNLDLEIRIARDTWDLQGSLETVNKAGRRIFRQSEKQALADKAQQVIDIKYADTLGQLRNLTQLIQPTLDSIDLDTATANTALLTQFQTESTQMLDAPRMMATDPSDLRALIK